MNASTVMAAALTTAKTCEVVTNVSAQRLIVSL